jgi:hypothetical protein
MELFADSGTRLVALAGVLLLLVGGCKGGRINPGKLDGGNPKDIRIIWAEHGLPYDLGFVPDRTIKLDGPPTFDLTAVVGDPCTAGECGANLMCLANVCHQMCTPVDSCGSTTPECPQGEGCFWMSSFSGACMPGTAQYPAACGDGIWCIGDQLCVNIQGKGSMCLVLCKSGCPGGTVCGSTTTGCQICVPLF